MRKAAFFVSGLNSGGIENYLLRFLKYKGSSFSEIIVFCKSGRVGHLEHQYLKIPNVKIVKQKIGYFNLFKYIKLITYFSKNNVNSICDFTGNFAGLVILCGKLAGIKKRIVFYRGASDHFKKNLFKKLYNFILNRITYRCATDILSNSKAAFKYFYKTEDIDSRFKVIYNGIDISEFSVGSQTLKNELKLPKESYVIGHTGRFNLAKNHDTIVKVALNLLRHYDDIYFIMCGTGVKSGLEAIFRKNDLYEKVRLFDNREDIPLFLNSMDAFFFPSITEGQPNSLIEAMIMGLPIVASNILPIKETMVNCSNLFDPLDVNGFTLALEKLYHSRKGRDPQQIQLARLKFNHIDRFNELFNLLA